MEIMYYNCINLIPEIKNVYTLKASLGNYGHQWFDGWEESDRNSCERNSLKTCHARAH
jgi:hypothetical protein